jgi:hypothetical protein
MALFRCRTGTAYGGVLPAGGRGISRFMARSRVRGDVLSKPPRKSSVELCEILSHLTLQGIKTQSKECLNSDVTQF